MAWSDRSRRRIAELESAIARNEEFVLMNAAGRDSYGRGARVQMARAGFNVAIANNRDVIRSCKAELKDLIRREKQLDKEEAAEEKAILKELKEEAAEEKARLKAEAAEEKARLKEEAAEEKARLKAEATEEKARLKEEAAEEKARLKEEAAEEKSWKKKNADLAKQNPFEALALELMRGETMRRLRNRYWRLRVHECPPCCVSWLHRRSIADVASDERAWKRLMKTWQEADASAAAHEARKLLCQGRLEMLEQWYTVFRFVRFSPRCTDCSDSSSENDVTNGDSDDSGADTAENK
jgi:chemotaxis protein histidine kinase CheA